MNLNNKAEEEFNKLFNEFAKRLPRFPDGRIDYSHSDNSLGLACFVKFKDKILILKRSDRVLTYKGKWNVIGGYLDELKPIRKKIIEELKEELNIKRKDIKEIKIGNPLEFHDPSTNKTWIAFLVLAEMKRKPEIKLDFEHTEFKWIKPEEIADYDIVYKLDENLKKALVL